MAFSKTYKGATWNTFAGGYVDKNDRVISRTPKNTSGGDYKRTSSNSSGSNSVSEKIEEEKRKLEQYEREYGVTTIRANRENVSSGGIDLDNDYIKYGLIGFGLLLLFK